MSMFGRTTKKKAEPPARLRIRKDDLVTVISGRDKGKQGRVLAVNPKTGRALVQGVQMVKRHTRPNPQKQVKGGIAEREGPIAVSNLMIVCGECGPTRIGQKIDTVGGKTRRTRVCRKCGRPLEKK